MLRRLTFLLVVTLVFGLVPVYPATRLATWLFPEWSPSILLMLVMFLLPFPTRYLQEHWSGYVGRALSGVVLTWLGVCFIALCLLLPAELMLLISEAPRQETAWILISIVAVLSIWGIINAQRLHVVNISITPPTELSDILTKNIRGMTLAQISDVHIGSRQPGLLKKIVNKTNHLNADYVLITGDLIDWRNITTEDLAPLGELRTPTYFCIGNHERYVDLEAICSRLSQLGIIVLRNQSVDLNPIQFVGVDDAERKDQLSLCLPKLTPLPDRYRVLLYHRSDDAEAAATWGSHLMLTGHTHRGQIVPFNFLVAKVFPRLYRDYSVQGMLLYVSPGTGTWGPVMRLGSKCEITLFTLL